MDKKELAKEGCKYFICPNMLEISITCESLKKKYKSKFNKGLVIEVSKKIAIGYLKNTYENPDFTRSRPLIIACVYIACKGTGHYFVSQQDISEVSGITTTAIRKAYLKIAEELDLIEVNSRADRKITLEKFLEMEENEHFEKN